MENIVDPSLFNFPELRLAICERLALPLLARFNAMPDLLLSLYLEPLRGCKALSCESLDGQVPLNIVCGQGKGLLFAGKVPAGREHEVENGIVSRAIACQLIEALYLYVEYDEIKARANPVFAESAGVAYAEMKGNEMVNAIVKELDEIRTSTWPAHVLQGERLGALVHTLECSAYATLAAVFIKTQRNAKSSSIFTKYLLAEPAGKNFWGNLVRASETFQFGAEVESSGKVSMASVGSAGEVAAKRAVGLVGMAEGRFKLSAVHTVSKSAFAQSSLSEDIASMETFFPGDAIRDCDFGIVFQGAGSGSPLDDVGFDSDLSAALAAAAVSTRRTIAEGAAEDDDDRDDGGRGAAGAGHRELLELSAHQELSRASSFASDSGASATGHGQGHGQGQDLLLRSGSRAFSRRGTVLRPYAAQAPPVVDPVAQVLADPDQINANPAMVSVLRVIEHVSTRFPTAPGDPMPDWMERIRDRLALEVDSSNARPGETLGVALFLAKIVMNRADLFGMYAADFVGPLGRLLCREGCNGGTGIHYFVRDIAILLAEWGARGGGGGGGGGVGGSGAGGSVGGTGAGGGAGSGRDGSSAKSHTASPVRPEPASLRVDILAYLMRHAAYPDKLRVQRSNLMLIKCLMDQWRHCTPSPGAEPVRALLAEPFAPPATKADQDRDALTVAAGSALFAFSLSHKDPPSDQDTVALVLSRGFGSLARNERARQEFLSEQVVWSCRALSLAVRLLTLGASSSPSSVERGRTDRKSTL